MGDLEANVSALSNQRDYQEALATERDLLASQVSGKGMTAPEPKQIIQPPSQSRAVMHALLRGTMGLGATVGGITGYAGSVIGSETVKNLGQTVSDYWTSHAAALPSRDSRKLMDDPSVLISPGWWSEHLAEAAPGFAAFLLPSVGAARVVNVAGQALKLTPAVISRLAYIGTKIAGPATFGGMELGGVYNEVKSRGGSDAEAVKFASEAGAVAAALGAINLHYILGEGGGVGSRFARGGVSTSIISFLNSGTRGAILGDDIWKSLTDAANSMPAMGVLGGAAGVAFGKPTPKAGGGAAETPPPQETPPAVNPKLTEMRAQFQAEIAAKQAAQPADSAPAGAPRPTETPSTTPQQPITPETAAHPDFQSLVFFILDGKKGTSTQRAEAANLAGQIVGENPQGTLADYVVESMRRRAEQLAPIIAAPSTKTPPEPEASPKVSTPSIPQVESLSPWQQKMVDMAEQAQKETPPPTVSTPSAQVETQQGPDYWPGFKNIADTPEGRIREQLDAVQQDATAEAARAEQARGTRTHEETQAAAQQAIANKEMTIQRILDAEPGTIWNADEHRAAVNIVRAAARRVAYLSEQALKGLSPDVRVRDSLEIFRSLYIKVSAIASEAGRLLESQKMPAEGFPNEVRALYKEFGMPDIAGGVDEITPIDPKALFEKSQMFAAGTSDHFLAEQIAALPPAKQGKLLGLWARLGRAGMELFYGSILTPISAARNFFAIPATIGYYLGTVKAAEYLRRMGSQIAPDKVDAAKGIVQGTGGAAWAGLQTGLQDAWRLLSASYETAANVMKAEGVTKGLRAFESALREEAGKLGPMTLENMAGRPPAIASENFPELGETMGKLTDIIGLLARLPGITGISAGDIVSKVVNDRIGTAMKAHQLATAQGLEGAAFEAEVARLIEQRPPEIDQAGKDLANKNTFTGEEGMIGALARNLSHPLAKIFVSPFVRTPLRIMEYSLEGTPVIQNLMRGWLQDVRSQDASRRDLALGKMAVGWSMMAVVGGLAANGIVTGPGPRDPNEQKRWRENGWLPNSVVLGDYVISIEGMEPLTTWIGTFADFVHIASRLPEESIPTLLMTLAVAAGDNLMSKRYVQGFSDWLTALSAHDPEERIKAIRRRLELPLPFQSVLRTVKNEVDPQVKDARTLLERYAAQIPGWSGAVPPLRNIITGEIQVHQGAWGPDWLSPFFTSTLKHDRVLDELIRLKGAGLKSLPDAIGGQEQPVVPLEVPMKPWGAEITSQQRDRWIVLMTQEVKQRGQTLHQALDGMISAPRYAEQSDLTKQMQVGSLYASYKQAGLTALLKEDRELQQKVMLAQGERKIAELPPARHQAARERLQLHIAP